MLEQPLWDPSWPLSDIRVLEYVPLHNAPTLHTNTGTLSDKLIVAPPFLRHFRKNSFNPFLRPLSLRPEIANPKSFHGTLPRTGPIRIYIKRETKLQALREKSLVVSGVLITPVTEIAFLTTTPAAKITLPPLSPARGLQGVIISATPEPLPRAPAMVAPAQHPPLHP